MEASRARRESQAEMAGQVRSASWGPKGRRETLALSGLRGWQESLGPLASLGPLGQDFLGPRGTRVAHQDLRETRAAPGCQERKVLEGNLGSRGCQD